MPGENLITLYMVVIAFAFAPMSSYRVVKIFLIQGGVDLCQ